ncbi:acyl-CoA--sterol O-acyltransferase 1-like [Silene latifolia]|uniref:acyl-CoA--sterol O-acyltransferase 1-like n=1 Tax=Silene latifolia TaxID=37657 RepID=UPI003D7744F0
MVELAEDELWNLGKVWALVFASLTYCYVVGKLTPKGFTRLVAILPVIALFLVLPLKLTSIFFCGLTAFFISWLANFKLLLFAFGKPPLWLNAPLPFHHFLAVASFPINMHSGHNNNNNNKNILVYFPWNYIVKGAIVILLSWILYGYNDYIHLNVLLIIYIVLVQFNLEVILACVAGLTRFFLALELKPQFKDPLSSNSIQDFWGKRWNLMATDILRPTVYQPSRVLFTKIIGQKMALYPAVMTTFMVSAIVHEVIFFHLGRTTPTFEITWYFLGHGLFLCLEIAAKKHFAGKWEVPCWFSRLVTLSFIVVTSVMFFIPPLLRIGSYSRMLKEYAAVYSFLRSTSQVLW